MLIIKPKYKKKKKKIVLRVQTRVQTEYGATKPKKRRIDRLINGKGIIYQ